MAAQPPKEMNAAVSKLDCLLNKDRHLESRNLYIGMGVCLALAGAIMSGLHIKDLVRCYSDDYPEERDNRVRNVLCLLVGLLILATGIMMCHKGQCVAQRLMDCLK